MPRDTKAQLQEEIRHLRQALEASEQEVVDLRGAVDRHRAFSELAAKAASMSSRLTPEGTYLQASPSSHALLGYAPGELRDRSFFTQVHPEDRASVRDVYRQVMEQPEACTWVYRIRHKDGHYLWFETISKGARDDAGTVHEILSVSRNITLRREAQDRLAVAHDGLAEKTRTLEAILTSTSDHIYLFDADKRCQYAGRSGLTGLDHAMAQVEGKTWREAGMPPEIMVPIESHLDAVLAKGKSIMGEAAHTTVEGRRSYEYQLNPVLEEAQGVVGVVCSIRDITERKEIERRVGELNETLADRAAKLEAANAELDAFTYSVSHDLRAPLRALIGFSNLLIDQYGPHLDEKAVHYLERVQANTRKMSRLVEDLLRFARLSRQPLFTEPVHPGEIVQEVVDELSDLQPGRRVQIRVEPLPPCLADAAMLRQVFANLIDNALKYTQQRAVPSIKVGATMEADRAVFFVADNGIGFDMRYVDKLFGVFQRLHRADDYEGTGVGLAIVERIITRHGGEVWAEAEPDHGATFYFTLPSDKAL